MTQPQSNREDTTGLELLGFLIPLAIAVLFFLYSNQKEQEELRVIQEAQLASYKVELVQQWTEVAGVKCRAVKGSFEAQETTTLVTEASNIQNRTLYRVYQAITIPAGARSKIEESHGVSTLQWSCNGDVLTAVSAVVRARDILDPSCRVRYYISGNVELARKSTCFPF